jgi:hypothetical protein
MSRRIFCSSKLLAEIFIQERVNNEANLLLKLWNSSISFFIDEYNYQFEDLITYKEVIEDYRIQKVISSYDDTQVDFRSNNKALLNQDKIYEFHNDIFIIDEDDEYCELKIKEYGILVISEYSLKNLSLIFMSMFCKLNPNLSYPMTATNLAGWDYALRESEIEFNFKPIAVNSILICDLYALTPNNRDPKLLTNDNDIGIENLKSLINYLISYNPNAKIDITLFTNIYKKTNSGNRLGGLQFPISIAKKCLEDINNYFPNVSFEIFLHDNHPHDLHGRYIITNFFRIRDSQEKGIRVFYNDKLKEKSGYLEFDGIFKYLNNNAPKGELNDINDWIKKCIEVKDYVIKSIKYVEEIGKIHQSLFHLKSPKIVESSKYKFNRFFYNYPNSN